MLSNKISLLVLLGLVLPLLHACSGGGSDSSADGDQTTDGDSIVEDGDTSETEGDVALDGDQPADGDLDDAPVDGDADGDPDLEPVDEDVGDGDELDGDAPVDGDMDGEAEEEALEEVQVMTPDGVEASFTPGAYDSDVLGYPAEDLTLDTAPLDEVPLPDLPDMAEVAGAYLKLEPQVQFEGHLLLTLDIPAANIPADSVPGLAWYDEERGLWVPQQATVEVQEDGTQRVSARLPQTGLFGVFAKESPSKRKSRAADSSVKQVWIDHASASRFKVRVEFYGTATAHATLVGPSSDWDFDISGTSLWDGIDFSNPEEGKYQLGIVRGSFFSGAVLDWMQEFQVGGFMSPSGLGMADLAAEYAPLLSFHPDEQYCPVPLNNDYFKEADVSIPYHSRVTLSGSQLSTYLALHGHAGGLIEGVPFGWGPWADNTCNPLTYVSTVYWTAQESGDYVFLTYWVFFSHDSKSPSASGTFARHDRDRESMTVVLEWNGTDYTSAAGLFYAHLATQELRMEKDSSGVGISNPPAWKGMLALRWSDMDYDRTWKHPIIHLAQGSHAPYPRQGTFKVMGMTEGAGGGALHCPTGANVSGSGSCDRTYTLAPLGVNNDLTSSGNFAFLSFSGDWVDVPVVANEGFPPFVERTTEIPAWSGSFSNQAGKFPAANQMPRSCTPDPCNGHGNCNSSTGSCSCFTGYTNADCNACVFGYSGYPDCQPQVDGDLDPDPDLPDGDNADGDIADGDTTDGDTDHEILDADLTWVSIPGGTFQMGCVPQDINCSSNESPLHSVTVSAFQMTQTEITQDQYYAVTGERPSEFSSCGGDCPVENINWNQAMTFCEAVGGRLPSEAEWEYAARAGTETIYICGDDSSCLYVVAWWYHNSNNTPHPVGQKAANAFGLYDMAGNVFEWTHDWYHGSYDGAPTDGSAWESPSGSSRVLRGSSFGSDLRASIRDYSGPIYWYDDLGFRCVRDITGTDGDIDFEISDDDVADGDSNDNNLCGNGHFDAGEKCEIGDVIECCRLGMEGNGGIATCNATCTGWTSSECGFTDPDSMHILARTFVMGSPDGVNCPPDFPNCDISQYPAEFGRNADEKQHQVILTYDFEMTYQEVTQINFTTVMGWNPPNFGGGDCGDSCPVEMVSWYDALAYTNQLSSQWGVSPCFLFSNVVCSDATNVGADYMSCMNATQAGIASASIELNGVSKPQDCPGFRLPTEAEWEYAARAGSRTAFYPINGHDGSISHTVNGCTPLDGNLDQIAWYCGNDSPSGTKPVGGKIGNAWGLVDMAGNVGEWVWDKYDTYSEMVRDPVGASSGSDRVVRGGSYHGFSWDARSAARSAAFPGNRDADIGFRTVMTSHYQLNNLCGNGQLDADEVCELGDTKECTSFGPWFIGGMAACKGGCKDWNVVDCILDQDWHVKKIAAGSMHTCAVTSSGGVKCWGSNNSGQLGDGTFDAHTAAVDVTGLSGVVSITAGDSYTCALTIAGRVKCWGNSSPQYPYELIPTDVNPIWGRVVAVSTSGSHTCALTATGGAKCLGSNYYGELGNGCYEYPFSCPSNCGNDVTGLASGVIAVEAAGMHSCAALSTGDVKCWGWRDMGPWNGVCGYGSWITLPRSIDLSGISSMFTTISSNGPDCGLTSDGGVACWGYVCGLLGPQCGWCDGPWFYTETPWLTAANLHSGVISISTGGGHFCALTSSHGVKCLGGNDYGQLGNGTTDTYEWTVDDQGYPVEPIATQVEGLESGVFEVSAGTTHTCVLMSEGGIKCWGANSSGQLGDGTTEVRLVPVNVIGFP